MAWWGFCSVSGSRGRLVRSERLSLFLSPQGLRSAAPDLEFDVMTLIANLDTANVAGLVPSYNRYTYGASIASFTRPADCSIRKMNEIGAEMKIVNHPKCSTNP